MKAPWTSGVCQGQIQHEAMNLSKAPHLQTKTSCQHFVSCNFIYRIIVSRYAMVLCGGLFFVSDYMTVT